MNLRRKLLAGYGVMLGLLPRIEQLAGLVRQSQEELRQAMAAQQMDTALGIFAQRLQPRLEEIAHASSSLVEHQNSDLAATAEASATKATRARTLTVGIALLALVVGFGVLWVVRGANLALQNLASRMSQSAGKVANAAGQVSGA